MNKFKLYSRGDYSIPVPPVPTIMWSTKDWINYIDSHGVWLTVDQIINKKNPDHINIESTDFYQWLNTNRSTLWNRKYDKTRYLEHLGFEHKVDRIKMSTIESLNAIHSFHHQKNRKQS